MKRFLLLSLLAMAIGVYATDDQSRVLVVNTTNDMSDVVVDLNYNPQITFENNEMIISWTNGEGQLTRQTIKVEKIQNFGYKKKYEVATNVSLAEGKDFVVVDNKIMFSGLGNVTVRMYDSAGKMVASKKASNGIATLSVGQLSQGVYVINVNGKTAKFVKK